jgi:hypothetical protein
MDEDEYNMYNILSKGNASHPGYNHVRTYLPFPDKVAIIDVLSRNQYGIVSRISFE